MSLKQVYPKYRWVVGILLFLGLAGLNILWFAPSPLLTEIMEDLGMNLMQGGLIMSVVCLMIAVIGVIGGTLSDKLGSKRVFAVGLWLMGIGAGLNFAISSFQGLFGSRMIIGLGIGLCLPVTGALIMEWFPENERPYINTVNSVLPYVATTITFTLTVPVYVALNHSWKLTLTSSGIYMVVIAVAWSIWGRGLRTEKRGVKNGQTERNLIKGVLKSREVILLSIAEAGDMWSFQFLTSYLPTYYITEVGLNIETASNVTAVFPIAGIIAGLLCGFWMSKTGRRKPFTWPLHLVTFIGTLLAINGTGFIRILGVSMAGFGNAGWAPALFTMPMEFENMTPARVGAVYAVVLSSGFLAAFISPWIGGWLGESIGLHDTIFLFSFSSLIAALCTFLMKETGPLARKQSISI